MYAQIYIHFMKKCEGNPVQKIDLPIRLAFKSPRSSIFPMECVNVSLNIKQ